MIMRKLLYKLILLLFFQNLYSQHSVLNFPFFYLPTKQKPISNKSANYDLTKEYKGSIVFDEVEYNGNIILRKDSAIVGDVKIYRFNKKLTKLTLESDVDKILIERVAEGMFLHRVLLDSLGIKLYDMKLYKTLENEKVDVLSLKLSKGNQFVNFPNSFLRCRKGKINAFLRKSALNKEQELYLRNWLESNI